MRARSVSIRGITMSTATLALAKFAATAADRGSLRLAAIDVGSNSIHMIIAQADADGAVTTLWRMKEPVGLQAG